MFWRRQLRPGQKGGLAVGKTKRGKGTKWLVFVDGQGTPPGAAEQAPLGAYLDSASPSEVTLLEKTLDTVSVRRVHRPGRPRKRPDRLVLDRGYDSNHLREQLVKRGIEPIIPARSNNRQATHQDGRKLRRYRHRWIVERTFSPGWGASAAWWSATIVRSWSILGSSIWPEPFLPSEGFWNRF